MNDLHRGEIYYISRGGASYGHEQQADRPAVIVSNEKNNENSGVVEVVYLTTQPKTDLPTHTVIRSTGRVSTVLCEQIVSVSVDRIAGYIGQVYSDFKEHELADKVRHGMQHIRQFPCNRNTQRQGSVLWNKRNGSRCQDVLL